MITNHSNLPLPLAVWLASNTYTGHSDKLTISATTFNRSIRYIIAQLRMKYPHLFDEDKRLTPAQESLFNTDVIDAIPAKIGTAIHDAIDKALTTNLKESLLTLGYSDNYKLDVITEQRVEKEFEGFNISGQFDVVINGELHDIKTTSTFSYTSGAMDDKYILQGSIYRWLNPELITGDFITINFIFTDFNKNYVHSRDEYPPQRALAKSFPLWSLNQTEMFISNKLNQIKKYWNEPLETIPCCTDKDLYSGPSVYKYYKNGFSEGKRSTKNFNTYAEAIHYKAQHGFQGDIIEDKGKPFKCPCCDLDLIPSFLLQTVNIG